MKIDISVVIPIYNEAGNISLLYQKLKSVLPRITNNYEIIFVDDGSKDSSFYIIQNLNKKDSSVKLIQLRRNYGKSTALSAGFEKAIGDLVITMDGDMQDDPEDITSFIDKINKGYDLVNGWKVNKHKEHSFAKVIASRLFNKMTAKSSGLKIHDFNCPFKCYRNEVVKDINLYGDMHRYIPLLVYQKGYKIGEIKVKNYPRKSGKTHYGVTRIFSGFLDLITVEYLLLFNKKPLHLFGTIGLVSFIFGFLISLYLTLKKFLLGMKIGGEPLLLLGVLLLIMGVNFISLGLIVETIISFEFKKEKYGIKKEIGFKNK